MLNAEEEANKPEGMTTIKANGKEFEGMTFRIQVTPMDCTGCGSCVNVCPAKEKALVMQPVEEAVAEPVSYTHLDVYKRQVKAF